MRKIQLWILIMVGCVPFLTKAQSTYLEVQDTRSQPTLPGDYNRAARFAFKDGAAIGISDSRFCSLLGVRGWWNDDTGGPAHEIAFTSQNGMYYRAGTQAAGWGVWRKLLAENATGNVGIGTDVPKEKLSVNGKIRAQEVKVETTNWPDYVFADGYQLPSLKETANFIEENKHLPGVPKAAEIEENGLSLGEMNRILMQKVEELTLHMIDKDRRIEALEKKLNQKGQN